MFLLSYPMMWILLTMPVQKPVTTVCLHCSFTGLKNKHSHNKLATLVPSFWVYSYIIFGQLLSRVEQHDYLGMTIYCKRHRWNSQCQSNIKKANKTLGLLHKTLAPCSCDVKRRAHKSLVRPAWSTLPKFGAHIHQL